MCIAIFKPAGVSLPTDTQFTTCFTTNPDGAGFAYCTTEDKVQIVKGLMTIEDFLAQIKAQDFTNTPMLIHFRIGTHGDKSAPKHTHPFPVGQSKEEMEELVSLSDQAMIHNGIMYAFGYDKEISDSMAFARDALPTLLNGFPSKDTSKLVIDTILGTNKIAILNGDGTHQMHGTWIEDGGIFWSNNGYKDLYASCDPRGYGKTYKPYSGYAGYSGSYFQGDQEFVALQPAEDLGFEYVFGKVEPTPEQLTELDAKVMKTISNLEIRGYRVIPKSCPAFITKREYAELVCWLYLNNYIDDTDYEWYTTEHDLICTRSVYINELPG